MSRHEHAAYGPKSVGFAIVTVSDSRSAQNDESGDALADLAGRAGHRVVRRALVRDEANEILEALRASVAEGVDVVIFNGGTGLSPRDVTVEAVAPRFARSLPGFGEIFRSLSYQEIGAAAMASRAEAGVVAGRLVFLLPGSPAACRLAMERLILPEAGHLMGQIRRGRADGSGSRSAGHT